MNDTNNMIFLKRYFKKSNVYISLNKQDNDIQGN